MLRRRLSDWSLLPVFNARRATRNMLGGGSGKAKTVRAAATRARALAACGAKENKTFTATYMLLPRP